MQSLKALKPTRAELDGIETSTNDEQPLKANSPIDSIDCGNNACVNNLHPKNTLSPIDLIEDRPINENSIREEHPLNAFFSILVTEGGINIFCNDEQSLKALS